MNKYKAFWSVVAPGLLITAFAIAIFTWPLIVTSILIGMLVLVGIDSVNL